MIQDQVLIRELQKLFDQVREGVRTTSPPIKSTLGVNAKGDQVKWFDDKADKIIRQFLDKDFSVPVHLLSEEGQPGEFGKGSPAYTMVVDPVDGSDNHASGAGPSAMAVALLPYEIGRASCRERV